MSAGMLGNLRVLDLADETGSFCSRILGDLGADVIKIEKPGGDAARSLGPFYHDIPHPENSLYWFAYNLNKRGITLDITTDTGRRIFEKLISTAGIVVESFPPGRMDGMGLGYSALSQINPHLIMTSITAFGQQGPYRRYRSCDIVSMAMGGLMHTIGTPDHPPVRISIPQSDIIAGASAAMSTVIAYHHRQETGEGQHVDVSVQASVASAIANVVPLWELYHVNQVRQGSYKSWHSSGNTRQRTLWPCKDGYVTFYIMGGPLGEKTNRGMAKWIQEEGMAPDYLAQMDWSTFEVGTADQAMQNKLEQPVADFFLTHTKAELYQGALGRGIMVFPVYTARDIMQDQQLKARDFWVQVEHPEKNAVLTYPGFFITASETPCQARYRAPLIGEHNREIYEGDLGLSPEEHRILQQAAVI